MSRCEPRSNSCTTKSSTAGLKPEALQAEDAQTLNCKSQLSNKAPNHRIFVARSVEHATEPYKPYNIAYILYGDYRPL